MERIFDGQGITLTNSKDPGTDQSLPHNFIPQPPSMATTVREDPTHFGGLDYSRIGQADALGQACSEWVLVKGALRQEISDTYDTPTTMRGNVAIEIAGDETCTIEGNETRTIGNLGSRTPHTVSPGSPDYVTGNQTITVYGDARFTVQSGGSYFESMNGPVTRAYLKPVLDTFAEDYQAEQPDSTSVVHKKYDYSHVGIQGQMIDVQLEFEHVHIEGAVVHGEVKAVHVEGKPIHFTFEGIKNEDHALENRVKLVIQHLNVVEASLANVNNLGAYINILTPLS